MTSTSTDPARAATAPTPSRREQFLWATAVAFYGIGDLVTTLLGQLFTNVVEVGPLPALLFQRHGAVVFPGLKITVFACCVGIWWVAPRPHKIGVPFALAIIGVLVTGWNSAVLAVAFA